MDRQSTLYSNGFQEDQNDPFAIISSYLRNMAKSVNSHSMRQNADRMSTEELDKDQNNKENKVTNKIA